MDRTELTVATYAACVNAGSCAWPTPPANGLGDGPYCEQARRDHPMNCLSLDQATKVCAWAGKRLPTVPEWTWAAHDGDRDGPYPWGDAVPTSANVNACVGTCLQFPRFIPFGGGGSLRPLYPDDPWPTTAPADSLPGSANRWGNVHLLGNVEEWVQGARCGGSWGSQTLGDLRRPCQLGDGNPWSIDERGVRCARDLATH